MNSASGEHVKVGYRQNSAQGHAKYCNCSLGCKDAVRRVCVGRNAFQLTQAAGQHRKAGPVGGSTTVLVEVSAALRALLVSFGSSCWDNFGSRPARLCNRLRNVAGYE